jgi:hypothetical protein
MKKLLSLILLGCGAFQCFGTQRVKDPLLAYYQDFDRSSPISPKNQIYSFEADLTGDGHKSYFVTNDLALLGPHGDHAWSFYSQMESGEYQLISSPASFIDAGTNGPSYIGYIGEIQRYGAISMGYKHTVDAQYLEGGAIKSEVIDATSGSADDPKYHKYFGSTSAIKITTYTMDQLKQKYANPDPTNVIKVADASDAAPSKPTQSAVEATSLAPQQVPSTPIPFTASAIPAPPESSPSWPLIALSIIVVLGAGFAVYRHFVK